MKGGIYMAKNRIGELRRESGINQKELAEVLGVGQTTVSAWERGQNSPDSEALYKMSQIFNVSLGYLAGYEPESEYRGLTKEQYERFQEELKIEREKKIEDNNKDEIIEEHIFELWKNSKSEMLYEEFLVLRIFENLTKEEKTRAIKMLKLAFPKALS